MSSCLSGHAIVKVKCTKFDFGWALPKTPLGELTALTQTPLLDLRGLLLRERKEREGKGKEKEGQGLRGGKVEGRGLYSLVRPLG